MLLLMALIEMMNFPLTVCGGIVRGTARPWLTMIKWDKEAGKAQILASVIVSHASGSEMSGNCRQETSQCGADSLYVGRLFVRETGMPAEILTKLNEMAGFSVVRFHHLEKPEEDEFCLELSKLDTYDDVVERVAQHLGLHDPSKIRLTSHNCYSQQPKRQPI
ncbi:hypothetical protein L484_012066 [Morus notabilis]|uniref:Ubiquitin carboxyl-terminal hydrolase 7 ICP0-binding domain-containing protein n=1 Tax=Morus notabilis TaxID=981085 RepID=W9RPZ9_9ROSA|nr:hypothetical protein L484_012066 [Morus notabilis]